MWRYEDTRAGLRDALRLSRAMTFKSAAAGLPLGGGKGVPVTTDFDPARIYVYTENGVVTEIEGVGGGI